MAEGSLVQLADHPLHAVFHEAAYRPSSRRGRACRERETLRGAVTGATGGRELLLARPGRPLRVHVDSGSRITNRPVYQPVLDGQRLVVRASRCGSRLVADRIAFAGTTVEAERYDRGEKDGSDAVRLAVAAAVLLLGVGIVVSYRPRS